MRVLVAGASGAIGRPLVSALASRGHSVFGLAREAESAELLATLGAEPLVTDVLDRSATFEAVCRATPDVVVEQLSALPRRYTPEAMRSALDMSFRLKTAGGDNVYDAAVAAGATRYVAQSGCYYYRPGSGLADETEPFADEAPPLVAAGVKGLRAIEHRALGTDAFLVGTVLRYGFLYGAGTWFHPEGDVAEQLREGEYPLTGSGAGVWSFVHIADAVAATVAAIESDVSGAFNICDDQPVAMNDWLPAFARYVGAPPPSRVSVSPKTDPDARFYAEQLRGAANTLARAELGFDPRALPWL